jgi:hypothetical protein
MPGQPIEVYNGTPGTTGATIYTTPAGNNVSLSTILATNVTATAATVTIEHVPSGQAAGTGYMVAGALSVAANAVGHVIAAGEEIVLGPGDTLYALQGTANAVNLHIAGELLPFGTQE